LDHRLFSSDRRVERPRCGEKRGRGGRELRDLDRARPKCAVEITAEMTGDEDVDREAEDHDCEHGRQRRREHRAKPQAHRPRTKPTPRTVEISGGSPSFRRMFETYRSTTFEVAAPLQTWATACSRVTTRPAW